MAGCDSLVGAAACEGCSSLQQLPAQLPASLEHLHLEGCSSLQRLPDLSGLKLRELRVEGGMCHIVWGWGVGVGKNLVMYLK